MFCGWLFFFETFRVFNHNGSAWQSHRVIVLNDTYPTGLNCETRNFTYCYAEYKFPCCWYVDCRYDECHFAYCRGSRQTTLFQKLVKEINIKIKPHPTLEHFLQKKYFTLVGERQRGRERMCVSEREREGQRMSESKRERERERERERKWWLLNGEKNRKEHLILWK